eukprot:m.31552 g.31552  ORF g.31552 m.31552 type:complete len:444 (-) comp12086_c0_seq1:8-1339(-)
MSRILLSAIVTWSLLHDGCQGLEQSFPSVDLLAPVVKRKDGLCRYPTICKEINAFKDGHHDHLATVLENYIAFHRRVRRLPNLGGAPILVHRFKGTGGFTDRLRGIVLCLWVAIFTKRVFFIDNLFASDDVERLLVRAGPLNTTLPADIRDKIAHVPRYLRLYTHQGDNHSWQHFCAKDRRVRVLETNDVALKLASHRDSLIDECGVEPELAPLLWQTGRLCRQVVCNGIIFRLLYHAGPALHRHMTKASAALTHLRHYSLDARHKDAASLHDQAEGGEAPKAAIQPFVGIIMRTFQSTIRYQGRAVQTMLHDSRDDSARIQRFVDLVQAVSQECKRVIFIASDSLPLVDIVSKELGQSYVYHCCAAPVHVQNESTLAAWLQLFLDLEVGSRASRVVHGGGYFHEMMHHWHGLKAVPALLVTDQTSLTEFKDFLCTADEGLAL